MILAYPFSGAFENMFSVLEIAVETISTSECLSLVHSCWELVFGTVKYAAQELAQKSPATVVRIEALIKHATEGQVINLLI